MGNLGRVHLIIEGRVQGVFFRAFTQDIALSLGLNGWVRNLPDGTVEAVFEGERNKIEDAVRRCYKGPPSGMVLNIEETWEDYEGNPDSFQIRY